MRPSIGSKGKLRQQFNLHFSHTGCFFYRRTSTVDGAALPFAVQQLCRPLLGEKPDLRKLSTSGMSNMRPAGRMRPFASTPAARTKDTVIWSFNDQNCSVYHLNWINVRSLKTSESLPQGLWQCSVLPMCVNSYFPSRNQQKLLREEG